MMKFLQGACLLIIPILAAYSSAAKADVSPTCFARDASGTELRSDIVTTINGNTTTLVGTGDSHKFTVTVTGDTAQLELEDTRSGDKATLMEGELSVGEQVVLGLTTNEFPDKSLDLVCTGVAVEDASKRNAKQSCNQYFDQANCQSNGCRWDVAENRCEEGGGSLFGSCSGLQPQVCTQRYGCTWNGNACVSANAASCYNIRASFWCCITPGCRWDQVENQCEPAK